MRQVEIVDEHGRRILLEDAAEDGSGGWRYTVTFELETGRASIGVWDYGEPGLPRLFREVAERWQGFDGSMTFATIEGQFELTLTHDGKGMLGCAATLRQPWPPEWTTTMTMSIGAGAHAQHIAEDLALLFASPVPH